ncbi:MAG: hypothetical protein ACM3NQ_15755, partial [Bacteroidales bacterium]
MTDRATAFTRIACGVLLTACGACAPKLVAIPTGTGTPAPDFAASFDQASSACRAVHSLTADIGLAGRAGRQRVRGHLVAGFDEPASLRLEAVAPFGAPVFILVARENKATLWLEREDRVVTNVSSADILDALTGMRLGADVLRAIVAGCVLPGPQPSSGRGYPNGWLAVDIGSGATAYLRRTQGQWRIVAGQVADFYIGYDQFQNGRPAAITLQSSVEDDGQPAVNLALTLNQANVNPSLKANAFEVNVPPGAKPMTLDELRREGPLANAKK